MRCRMPLAVFVAGEAPSSAGDDDVLRSRAAEILLRRFAWHRRVRISHDRARRPHCRWTLQLHDSGLLVYSWHCVVNAAGFGGSGRGRARKNIQKICSGARHLYADLCSHFRRDLWRPAVCPEETEALAILGASPQDLTSDDIYAAIIPPGPKAFPSLPAYSVCLTRAEHRSSATISGYVAFGSLQGPAFTAQLDITYRSKISAGQSILCTAEVESIDGRKVHIAVRSFSIVSGGACASDVSSSSLHPARVGEHPACPLQYLLSNSQGLCWPPQPARRHLQSASCMAAKVRTGQGSQLARI